MLPVEAGPDGLRNALPPQEMQRAGKVIHRVPALISESIDNLLPDLSCAKIGEASLVSR